MADIGVIGLGVMGQNLVLNINDHGFEPAVYNRTRAVTEEFMAGSAKGTKIKAAYSIKELASILEKPRRILLMVKAGTPVDLVITELLPHLEQGDIIIDGGNSHYQDTQRRETELAEKGIRYIGMGISGGEEGARHGPSLMPGGDQKAWPFVQEIFQSISAKAPSDGAPCCAWIGEGGAGHYVKMTHNGIEYGDMQLIAEAYSLMRHGLGMQPEEAGEAFSKWNRGELDSYLIEITAEILKYKEPDGTPIVNNILDVAGQKGTGKWVGIAALSLGVPVTLIAEAVFARSLSVLKDERVDASRELRGPSDALRKGADFTLEDLGAALFASKVVSYAQGFMLMREAARTYGWTLRYGEIASIWRAGCIIRSAFLGSIKEAYDKKPALTNLLLDEYFRDSLAKAQDPWRRVLASAIRLGVPMPAFSAALSFYDGYRAEHLPANLIQAQRDYFGAHTYERLDKARGEFFHTNWTGRGGSTTAGSYNA